MIGQARIRAVVVLLALAKSISVLASTNGVYVAEPVVVWAERINDRGSVVTDDVWAGTDPSLAVRTQGACGTLADLTVNGSSFSEAGILLNGATVRNAQTEHFNADLPVPGDWLGTSRVLTGLDLFRSGAGHPAGSLVTEFDDKPIRGGRATIGTGLGGLVFGRINDLEDFEIGESGRGWGGAFVEGAHADRVDGYNSNPMDRSAAGGRFGFGADAWSFDSLVSWQWRDFGCRGAYGADEKYSAWEEDHTGLVTADWRYDAEDDQASKISFLWTRGHDDYWLYRDNPDFYRNTHLADSVTLHGRTRRHFVDWAFVDLRGDADADVYATTHRTDYTGTNPKSKHENFHRFHGSVAALPGVQVEDWELAAGIAGEFYSAYSATCAPAGGLKYEVDDESNVELSYREGCRMPSFTELTYDSPDSKGTKDLPLQRTRSLNLDYTWKEARLGAFLMRSEKLVDWLKSDAHSTWNATALDPVTAFGFSGTGEYEATKSLRLIPRGVFVLKQTRSDYWASRYAMDFPIVATSLEASYRILDNWSVSYCQGIEVWKSNPVRRGSSLRNVSRLETRFELPFCRDLEFTLGLSDLFDQAFEVYPGQRAFGLTGYLSVSYRW